MLAGTSSTWAVTVVFHIINNSGNEVMAVKGNVTKPVLPALAQTPFATNYRFYYTLSEAQNDALYGAEVAQTTYNAHAVSTSANLPDSRDLYVRYDYNYESTIKDADNNMVVIDGSVAYNWQVENRWVYYSTTSTEFTAPPAPTGGSVGKDTPSPDEPIRVTQSLTTDGYGNDVTEETKKTSSYQWLFIGTKAGYEGSQNRPDPYDIKIKNLDRSRDNTDKDKLVTAEQTASLPITPADQQYLHLRYWDDAPSSTNVQRFYFRVNNSKTQLAAAKPLYEYNKTGVKENKAYWFVFNKESDESKWAKNNNFYHYATLHMRIHEKQENNLGGDRATVLLHRQKVHNYIIVDGEGNYLISAYAKVEDKDNLDVPFAIKSPLVGEYTYYATIENAKTSTSPLNAESFAALSEDADIFVRYTYNPDNTHVKLDGSESYVMKLNDNFIKYQNGAGMESDVAVGNITDTENPEYRWKFTGLNGTPDPYKILISNEGAGTKYFTGVNTENGITLGTGDKAAAIVATDEASYTGKSPYYYFLVESPRSTPENPLYLLSPTYYNGNNYLYTWAYFGDSETDWNDARPRMFVSTFLDDSNDAAQMELDALIAPPGITYNIIDKQGKIVTSAQTRIKRLGVPASISSPLVSQYHYYTSSSFDIVGDVYTLQGGATELTSTDGQTNIYVTYDVGGSGIDIEPVTDNTEAGKDHGKHTNTNKTTYILQYFNGESFNQEDGDNGIMAEVQKAFYPYGNGDGGFNVYGEERRNIHFAKAASERSRYTWYLDSDDNDPYHVRVVAANNVTQIYRDPNNPDKETNAIDNYYAYFRTYYNEQIGQVVTNTISKDPLVTTHQQYGDPTVVPTEYMLLGTKGKYRLVTSNVINGAQQVVDSYEQYWKNYETIQQKLGDGVLPADADLIARGWHKYDEWKYAKPLNGSDKVYEYQNHWFQTIHLGADFDLVPTSLKPGIILLDNHKWEIFRYTMCESTEGLSGQKLIDAQEANDERERVIKSYDSPMVKAYHWYKNATKIPGYHKYSPSSPALDETGEVEYTSTSLSKDAYPPNYNNNTGDWYVTYEVKDEYTYLYNYNNGSPIAAPVLIKQGGKWAKADNTSSIGSDETVTVSGDASNLNIEGTVTNDMLWYLKRNTDIDYEMGYCYSGETGAESDAKDKAGTEAEYNDTQQSFDPYNFQIQNIGNSKFFKTNATGATLSNKGYIDGVYPGDSGSLSLGDNTPKVFDMEGYYDSRTPHVSNATFMALVDNEGNMRFVPRFAHWHAVTNLTSGTPTLAAWLDADPDNTQTIELQPIQRYQFFVYDAVTGDERARSEEFLATPGSPLASGPVAKAKNIPLPDDLIRAYCDYTGAFTVKDVTSFSNRITVYPTGAAGGVSVTSIYVPYQVSASLYSTFATPSWYNISLGVQTEYAQAESTINNHESGSGSTHVLKSTPTQHLDESKWALIGNPYDFKLINKKYPGTSESPLYLSVLKNIESDNVSSGLGKDKSGFVERAYLATSTAGSNDWTLVYIANSKGEVVPALRTTNKGHTVNGSGDYYLYLRRNGSQNFNNGTQTWSDNNIAGAQAFLTNLLTITYHVYKVGTTDAHVAEGDTESNADYEESIDYDPSEFADMTQLPGSVARQLTDYVVYKSLDELNSATNGYASFAKLYESLTEEQKTQGMDLYLTYQVKEYSNTTAGNQSGLHFFPDVATAKASNDWSFLVSGLESTSIIYGKQLVDYGKQHEYYPSKSLDKFGTNIDGLTQAEQSFVQHSGVSNKVAGFHFIRRTSPVIIDPQTGTQSIDKEAADNAGSPFDTRYIVSQNDHPEVFLMSPLNDFRRIAETYKEGNETEFREDSWLWAFIGTPYKFEIINREAVIGENNEDYKRLVIVKANKKVQLVSDYEDETKYERYWTMAQYDTGVKPNGEADPEFPYSFGIKSYESNRILRRETGSAMTMSVMDIPSSWDEDIAYHKSTSFMAYPWNWSDNKYKTVTVNIYKGSVSGTPVLTKTYTPADRAFKEGDVIDGTDGHFYLPIEKTSDNDWKPAGVITNTVPYDGHLINIPYELRRKYCSYSVVGGSFTVTSSDDEQTLNIIYNVQTPPNAPYFVSEDELSKFRGKTDTQTFNGVTKRDYYYFLDVKNDLSQYTYISDHSSSTPRFQGTSSTTRYSANDPAQLMFYFVGDPYKLRLCNVYTDANSGGNYRNLIRNLKPNGESGEYGTLITNDDATYMEQESSYKCYWEMVDAQNNGSYGYNAASANVDYRLDFLEGKGFALRTLGGIDAQSTYYYLTKSGRTVGQHIYNPDEATVNARGNIVAAFSDFPDVRHTANSIETIVTAMKPATVHVSVYDQDEPAKLVTKNELSEFYAMSERFQGVPVNLQRKYCNYTWASTTPKGANMLDGGYFEINDRDIYMYVKYQETSDSPFSKLVNGKPVLKRNANLSPWYNMSINNAWAWFNSNLVGLTETVYNWDSKTSQYSTPRDHSGGKPNNSVVSFPYTRAISAVNDRFHKGLHWALVGDPYNFQIRCQRDIITFEGEGDSRTPKKVNGDYEYTPAYLNETTLDSEENATWWTWIRNRSTSDYFLSESLTRRTEVEVPASATSAKADGPRRLPIDYPQPDPSVNPESHTKNFKLSGESGVIVEGNNYGLGDVMRLVSVNDVSANNECFDAVVIVYNKMNEPVATTGWTELARKDASANGRIPADVQRWGCTYHYWADETMTRYPFTNFAQKDANDNYLIQDGGIVYVNYDYDESLYSSENEYRWVNLFFNWDDTKKEWNKTLDNSQVKYTSEYYELNATSNNFELRKTTPVTVNEFETDDSKKAYKYDENILYTDTRERWVTSTPTYSSNPLSPTPGAWAIDTEQSESKDQKWVMIGDPYKFILYSYNRRAEAGGANAYYLIYNPSLGGVFHKKFSNNSNPYTPYTKETFPGLYWTWKVDGTSYRYQSRIGDTNASSSSIPEGISPTGIRDGAIQTGYLGICDMTKTSLYDNSSLLGSVLGYISFKHAGYNDVKDDETSSTFTKGYKEKYHVYNDGEHTVDYTTFNNITDETERAAALSKWINENKKTYTLSGSVVSGGDYDGCYIGPNMEQERDTTVYSMKQTWTADPADNQKYLYRVGDASQSNALILGGAERFLVMPMKEQAASVTFHLDTDSYANGTTISSQRNFTTNPIPDHTTTNFGVNNTIVLPWMMRRQYCDYKFYVVMDGTYTPGDAGYNLLAPENYPDYIDELTHNPDSPSNERKLSSRGETYNSFWANHVTEPFAGIKVSEEGEGDNKKDIYEIAIPDEWKNKHIYLVVKYQPTDEFEAMRSTGAEGAKWLNLTNEQQGNMMRYTRSENVTGADKAKGAHTTNDYLWAIEGDPYGFVLHNRYADHGFNGSVNEFWDTKKLETTAVNATLNYNSSAGGGITFGPAGEATAPGTMGNGTYKVYEAMTGNYTESMLIHPVDACINVRNQNGYKYTGAFMFNGAPTDCPVQLNYLEEWEAMRNVYANWRLEKPTAEQLIPYFDRAGYVGGLTATVAEANSELFTRLKGTYAETTEGQAQKTADIDAAMALVQNAANLVAFTPGYYRLKTYTAFANSETDTYTQEQLGGHYVSGYLHKAEQEDGGQPLHLFGKMGESTTMDLLDNYDGIEWANGKANTSILEVMDPEYDPSSVFYVTRQSSDAASDDYRFLKLQTQGLVVSGSKMQEESEATEGNMYFELQDIGQTAFQIRTKASATAATPVENAYLSCNPNVMKYGLNIEGNELNVYEGVHDAFIHDTKWVLEPVGAAAENKAGTAYQQPLKLKLTDLGDAMYYATVAFPFDVKVPTGAYAYSCSSRIRQGEQKTAANGSKYYQLNITLVAGAGAPNDNSVLPAGVPAIIYVDGYDLEGKEITDPGVVPFIMASAGDLKLSDEFVADLRGSDMKYQYLTQELSDVGGDEWVFVFSKNGNNVGFMRNTTRDYDNVSNNKFVQHNRIYYVQDKTASSTGRIVLNFVDALEDFQNTPIATGVQEFQGQDGGTGRGDNTIYDLQGRKVTNVTRSGVYIVNGKKVVIHTK